MMVLVYSNICVDQSVKCIMQTSFMFRLVYDDVEGHVFPVKSLSIYLSSSSHFLLLAVGFIVEPNNRPKILTQESRSVVSYGPIFIL